MRKNPMFVNDFRYIYTKILHLLPFLSQSVKIRAFSPPAYIKKGRSHTRETPFFTKFRYNINLWKDKPARTLG